MMGEAENAGRGEMERAKRGNWNLGRSWRWGLRLVAQAQGDQRTAIFARQGRVSFRWKCAFNFQLFSDFDEMRMSDGNVVLCPFHLVFFRGGGR